MTNNALTLWHGRRTASARSESPGWQLNRQLYILKKRKKEPKSLLINIELPIELPSWGLASAKRCLGSGLGTARPSVTSARVWPWPRRMSGSSLVRAWPRLRPRAQDQAHAQRCSSFARSSSAAECFLVRMTGVRSTENYYLCLRVVSFKS